MIVKKMRFIRIAVPKTIAIFGFQRGLVNSKKVSIFFCETRPPIMTANPIRKPMKKMSMYYDRSLNDFPFDIMNPMNGTVKQGKR